MNHPAAVMSSSSVSSYELPYRCPKCGNDSSNFKSLKELRIHLETSHTLTSDPEGRRSPLTECFTKEAEELERRLRLAKETETNNKKLSWLWNESVQRAGNEIDQHNLERKVDSLVEASLQSKLRHEKDNSLPHNLGAVIEEAVQSGLKKNQVPAPAPAPAPMTQAPAPAPLPIPMVSPNVAPLVDELFQSRLQELQMSDAMASTREHLEDLRRSADRVAAEHCSTIDRLKNQLQTRDKELEKADRELDVLTAERHVGNEIDQHNLERKVDSLVEASLQSKLLHEKDNSLPHNLGAVIEEAVQSGLKKNQVPAPAPAPAPMTQAPAPAPLPIPMVSPNVAPLVDELFQSRLQKLQMSDAMASTREHLEDLRRSADRVAAEHCSTIDRLKNQLQTRDKELEKADRELDVLTAERRRLKHNLATISQENAENEGAVAHVADLEAEIEEKDELIDAKQSEVSELTLILQSAAEKESVARKKLESFIDDLFDRAERAESELRKIKQQGTMGRSSSQTLPMKDKLVSSRPVRSAGDLHGVSSVIKPDVHPRDEYMSQSRPTPADTVAPLSQWLTAGGSSPSRPGVHPYVVTHSEPDADEATRLARQYIMDLLNSSPMASRAHSSLDDGDGISAMAEPWSTSKEHAHIRRYLDEDADGILIGPESANRMWPQYESTNDSRGMPNLYSEGELTGSSVAEDLIMAEKKAVQEQAVPEWLSPLHPRGVEDNLRLDGEGILWDATPRSAPQDLSVKLAREHLLEHESHPLNELLESDVSAPGKKAPPRHVEHISGMPASESWRPLSPRGTVPQSNPQSLLSDEHNLITVAKLQAEQSLKAQQQQLQRQLHLLQNEQKALHSGICSVAEAICTWSDNDSDLGATEIKLDQAFLPAATRGQARRRRDALFCIFMYLDVASLCQVALVNREWRDVSRHPALWRQVDLGYARVSSHFLATLSTWCTQLQSLTLQGLKSRPRRVGETQEEYLLGRRGCLEPGLECLLTTAAESLVSLRVVACGNLLTDRCLFLASCHCRHLQQVAYLSDTDPVGSEVMWALGAGCREVTTLLVPPLFPNQRPTRFNNRCLQMVGRCWPHLQYVCIGGPQIDRQGLAALACHCQQLECLELDHMREVTEDVADCMCRVGLKKLGVLDLTFTPVHTKALLLIQATCPRLTEINVHVGIADYFTDPQQPRSRRQFADVVKRLEKAREKFHSLRKILNIYTDY